MIGSRIAGNRTGVVYDSAPGGRMVGNLITRNGVWGFPNSGNVARRNGQKAQCLNVVCRRG